MRTLRVVYHQIEGEIINVEDAGDDEQGNRQIRLTLRDVYPITDVMINGMPVQFEDSTDLTTGKYMVTISLPPHGQKVGMLKILQAGDATKDAELIPSFGSMASSVTGLSKLVQRTIRYFFSRRGGGIIASLFGRELDERDIGAIVASAVPTTLRRMRQDQQGSGLPRAERIRSLSLRTTMRVGSYVFIGLDLASETGDVTSFSTQLAG